MKRIVIIGATSSIAEHCARKWLESQPIDLTLVGRDSQRLNRVAADLAVRSPKSKICVITTDFLDPESIKTTVTDVFEKGKVDIALIAHGFLPAQDLCQDDLQACHDALNINGLSPVLFAEAFAKHMQAAQNGTIALIGSVAGDRGRKSNYIYGAAKGLIARYAQGLQHRFAGTCVKVILIKPGPTATPMTESLKGKIANLASVALVANQIVSGIAADRAVVYTPKRWKIVMSVIMHLPAFIFNKLNI